MKDRVTPSKAIVRYVYLYRYLHILLLLSTACSPLCQAFSGSLPDEERGPFSRRDLIWKAPIGALATYGYGRLVYNAFSVQGIKYPSSHEDRVAATLETAIAAGSREWKGDAYRILEVGIGTDCRVARRGLYAKGLEELSNNRGISEVEVFGVDLQLPRESTVQEARRILSKTGPNIQLQVGKGDITSSLAFPDGYFDTILCCLTLCSVTDPENSLRELKRLLRPNGGTFGYVEHVAVNPNEEDRSFLELQQVWLDPFQQRLADNCHLHRYTEDTIQMIFGGNSHLIENERFFVDSMWPVSCQARGIVQRSVA